MINFVIILVLLVIYYMCGFYVFIDIVKMCLYLNMYFLFKRWLMYRNIRSWLLNMLRFYYILFELNVKSKRI